MTQHGNGADGAKELLTALKTNGVPQGLDQQAFKAYQNQIKEVGGAKLRTNSSEVFQTRIKILELIMDAQQ